MTDTIQTILAILHANGITKYDDDTSSLESFLLEAKLLVGEPFMFDQQYTDYKQEFYGDNIVTSYYPIKDDCIQLVLDGVDITSHIRRIDSDGIIYLDKNYHGALIADYTVGLSGDDIVNYLIPICVALIRDREGLNISSVTEGNVSVSYNNSTGSTTLQLDNLVNALKEKYGARVCLL